MLKITIIPTFISIIVCSLFKLLFGNEKSIKKITTDTSNTNTFVSLKNQKWKIRKWKKSKIKKHQKKHQK
jgi:hypothetical protein